VRVLALDYGAARCGSAVSDPSGSLATPLRSVERPDSPAGLEELVELVRETGAELVVVGLPLTLAGEEGFGVDELLVISEDAVGHTPAYSDPPVTKTR